MARADRTAEARLGESYTWSPSYYPTHDVAHIHGIDVERAYGCNSTSIHEERVS
jgi:hypothetical protein